jgi:hypothetical protein
MYDAHLLDEGAAALAQRAADHIDRRLALGLLLCVERDVRHLLARVEEGVPAEGRRALLGCGRGRVRCGRMARCEAVGAHGALWPCRRE